MGANISNLGRAIRTAVGESVRNIFEYSEEVLQDTHLRRLSLRDAEQNFSANTKSYSIKIVSCERGTECKLYISIYTDQNEKILDITMYQDMATSIESEIEVAWTNPTTRVVDGVNFNYPVDVITIKDLLM